MERTQRRVVFTRFFQSDTRANHFRNIATGNPKINMKYARQRAENVAQTLTSQFGISKNRIKVEAAGDTVQPYEQAELNRVSICIAK